MSEKSKKIAPYMDYNGNELREGDYIMHSSGEEGRIFINNNNNDWKVRYFDDTVLNLALQIGWKGRAIKSVLNTVNAARIRKDHL